MIRDIEPLAGYGEPYGLLCAALQDATKDWRQELDWKEEFALGPEVVTWRVRPNGQSIGAILLHMIIAEVAWFEWFVLGRAPSEEDRSLLLWNEIDVDEGKWPDPPAEPLTWYFGLQDRFRARTLEAVKDWPPAETLKEHYDRQVSMRWVLGHVIQHETYHGGQIVLIHDLWKAANS